MFYVFEARYLVASARKITINKPKVSKDYSCTDSFWSICILSYIFDSLLIVKMIIALKLLPIQIIRPTISFLCCLG